MAAICKGRTVIIIAHRLSAVRHAHRIVAMERGRIVEAGPHDELVQRPKGLYAYLWRMQQGQRPLDGASEPPRDAAREGQGPEGRA
jgi:subfamily B ATP-binding cassette protein HlyB/CyaB